jgi:hypothetical protein
MVTDDDIDYLNQLKMENRELAIDAVLDDKVEEYNSRRKTVLPSNTSSRPLGIGIIAPMVYSISISNPNKFQSYEEIWDRTISHIISNTQGNHPLISKNNITSIKYTPDPLKPESENIQIFKRRVVTRVMMMSNLIATTSRKGPATFALVGIDVLDYLRDSFFEMKPSDNPNIIGNLGGVAIILSNKVRPNKIIVGRTEKNIDGGGLIVLNDMDNYYMIETPHTFYKKFAWFEII